MPTIACGSISAFLPDASRSMPFGSPQEVANEVRRRIDQLAPGGGYVFAAVHSIQTDVPPENIAAMFQTAREYGVYGAVGGV